MLKINCDIKKLEEYGFKSCKAPWHVLPAYYLCVAADSKMLFATEFIFDIQDWTEDDERIHAKANCKYRDNRTSLDILYQLIKDGIVVSTFYEE